MSVPWPGAVLAGDVIAGPLAQAGHGLERPECVLAFRSGDLVASRRGAGVSRISPGGRVSALGAHRLVEGSDFVPNGLAWDRDGIVMANIGPAGGLWLLRWDGSLAPLAREADGVPLMSANFVLRDGQDRTWISTSTRQVPWTRAYHRGPGDGYIALLDGGECRLVAEGLAFTNEMRLDAAGRYLYVAETFAERISRYRLSGRGSLGERETFAELGPGAFPDGIAFDSAGHLWVTSVVSNRLLRVAPDGSAVTVLDDADPATVTWVEAALAAGSMGREHFYTQPPGRMGNLTSIAFGGPDLTVAYLGSLLGSSLVSFRVRVAGLPPVHWPERLPSF